MADKDETARVKAVEAQAAQDRKDEESRRQARKKAAETDRSIFSPPLPSIGK
jgi:hypothetical protein